MADNSIKLVLRLAQNPRVPDHSENERGETAIRLTTLSV